jgi:glycosyltransferase involved in cell wall biosynthesis
MRTSQARLLFVTTSTGLGGAEKVLARLALTERPDWSVVGVCSLKPAGHFGTALEREGIPVVTCGMRSGDDAAGVFATLGATVPLVRAVHQFRPTLLHAFLFRAGLLARLPALAGLAPRLVVSIRQIEERHPLLHLLDRCTAGVVDRFTAVSEAARRAIVLRSGIREDRIQVIPNGVDLPGVPDGGRAAETTAAVLELRRARRDRARRRLESITGPLAQTIVGCAGRLDPIKGHRVLLRAMEALPPAGRANGRPVLVLAGDGTERGALEALATGPALRGRVHLLGERADFPEILPAFDLFVLPSRLEGMSNALLEAMAEGIPAIATRAGGSSEVIETGVSGILVEPDDPATLAGAISALAAEPERARVLGLAGRERVRSRFSATGMLAAYHRLYESLLDPLG